MRLIRDGEKWVGVGGGYGCGGKREIIYLSLHYHRMPVRKTPSYLLTYLQCHHQNDQN